MLRTIYRRFVLAAISTGIALSGAWAATVALKDNAKPYTTSHLVVHEWGTFTELQDEHGKSLAGINTDDEPVPKFVHGFGPAVLAPAAGPWLSKGIPRRHPHVTMRLETPVIYFYQKSTNSQPIDVNVHVQLQGGWLSEFYPRADSTAPGFDKMNLSAETTSSLTWNNLRIGTDGTVPETDDPVWLIPRQTDSLTVTSHEGESEKYLFYRGVGNFAGPLRVSTDRKAKQLIVRSDFDGLDGNEKAAIAGAWLVSVKPEGHIAYRTIGALSSDDDPRCVLARISSEFEETDYSSDQLSSLHAEMHQALVEEGLYDKEATAMLNTWHRAYFESRGMRLVYIVPRAWTDERMPLTLSKPADVERVMVGRIELITERQRSLIEQIRKGPISSPDWMNAMSKKEFSESLFAGLSETEDSEVAIPVDFQAYQSLGRFRNSLLWAEQRSRPSAELTKFIQQYHLSSWQPEPQTDAANVNAEAPLADG